MMLLLMLLMLLSFVPRARRLRSCQTSLSSSLSYIMERQQIKLSDNSVRSSLPAEPVLLSPRCLLVLASSVPFFVLVPLPVRNLLVVNSHLPRPPSVCLPSLLCVYRTGSSTRANRTGRKKQPNRYRRGMRLGRSIAPLVLGQGGAPFLPVARKSLVGTSLFPKWNDDSNSPEFLLPLYGTSKKQRRYRRRLVLK